MKRYFVNTGNKPEYIDACFVQIYEGRLQFLSKDNKIIKEFKIHLGLHFDDLTKDPG